MAAAMLLSIVALILLGPAAPPDTPARERTDLYGDPLPPGAIARLGTVRLRHGDAVYSVAFSPDGRTLASAGMDETVCLWEATTGRQLLKLKGHRGISNCLAFSPDGKILVSAGGNHDDTAILLRETATGREILRLQVRPGGVSSVSFSGEGKILASAAGGEIRLWESETGKIIRTLAGGWVALSPRGKTLARVVAVSGGKDDSDQIRIFLTDASTGKDLLEFEGPGQWARSLAFSPDGKVLALSEGDSRTIRLWDVATGKQTGSLQAGNTVYGVAFSPDGRVLGAAIDRAVRLWKTGTWAEARTIRVPGRTNTVAFSPDSRHVAAGCGGNDAAVRVWEADSGRALLEPREQDLVYSVAFTPDGKTVVSAGNDRTVRLWDASSGKETLRIDTGSALFGVAVSPDGRRLASGASNGNGTVTLWDRANGTELHKLRGHATSITHLAFSPDGKTLASASHDATIRFWDVGAGREVMKLEGCKGAVRSIAFSPDGKTLVSVSDDRLVRKWDLATGKAVLEFTGGDTAVAFSADGRTLASGLDKTLRIWDADRGAELLKLEGHVHSVQSLAFSPDGKWLASASTDKTVRLWETASGREIARFMGHDHTVGTVAFSPLGNAVASGSIDTTALVWGLAPPERGDPASSPRDLIGLWDELSGEDARRAYAAIWALTSRGPEAVAFVKSRLAAAPRPSEVVNRLLPDLDHDDVEVREKAAAELVRRGEATAIRNAMNGKVSEEARARLQTILTELERRPPPRSLLLSRVTQVLERIGTREAREVLATLGTRDAQSALDRLERRGP